jgi:hypothetical protein
LALCAVGCVGGQTGEESGDFCFDGDAAPIELGEAAKARASSYYGAYQVPLYWVKWVQNDSYLQYFEASDAQRSELHVELRERDGAARSYEDCPEAVWVPVEVALHTDDGRVNQTQAVWLHFDPDVVQPSRAMLKADVNWDLVALGGGSFLEFAIDTEGQVSGRIAGERHGNFYAACGGRWQLPLDQRPDDAYFARAPTPADALAAIHGHNFEVDWGEGKHARLQASVHTRSETACWSSGGVRLEADLELLDEAGLRVAMGTHSFVGASDCMPDWPAECRFGINVGGELRLIAPTASLPVAYRNVDGMKFQDNQVGISDLAAFTGGAADPDAAWSWADYSIWLPVRDGQLGAPVLETRLTQESEVGMLRGVSIEPDSE